MKYKMIVMDMDGTLLDNKKTVSHKNKEALKKAASLGVKIAISTGRVFSSARIYGDIIEVNTPIISFNGAYIREKDEITPIHEKKLGVNNIKEIIKIVHKNGLNCHFYGTDVIYTEKLEFITAFYHQYNKDLEEDKRVTINMIKKDGWEEVIKNHHNEILKGIVATKDLQKLAKVREEMEKLPVSISSSNYDNFEIMGEDTSKGHAVEILTKHFGLDREEVIAMGDNENDISMIKYAGLGVAMGNATEETKAAADFVTLTNEEDGVACVIEKFILNK